MRFARGAAALTALTLAGITGIIAGMFPYEEQRVLEATTRMEWLAAKLEHAKRVAPETKTELTQLIRRPWYDCNQVACRTALEMRNRDARARLLAVLSISTNELNARTKQVPIHAQH